MLVKVLCFLCTHPYSLNVTAVTYFLNISGNGLPLHLEFSLPQENHKGSLYT